VGPQDEETSFGAKHQHATDGIIDFFGKDQWNVETDKAKRSGGKRMSQRRSQSNDDFFALHLFAIHRGAAFGGNQIMKDHGFHGWHGYESDLSVLSVKSVVCWL